MILILMVLVVFFSNCHNWNKNGKFHYDQDQVCTFINHVSGSPLSVLHRSPLYVKLAAKMEKTNMMKKFAFEIGSWSLEYHVPKSSISEANSGAG